MNTVNKLTTAALTMAIYIVIMYITQSFAFGQFQIRIATGLYALAYHAPFLILPISIANLLSNLLLGGMGFFDIIGGFIVALLTSVSIVVIKKINAPSYICCLPIGIIPSIIVPIWLSAIINVSYITLLLYLSIGQLISAYTLGWFIIKSKTVAKILG